MVQYDLSLVSPKHWILIFPFRLEFYSFSGNCVSNSSETCCEIASEVLRVSFMTRLGGCARSTSPKNKIITIIILLIVIMRLTVDGLIVTSARTNLNPTIMLNEYFNLQRGLSQQNTKL